MNCRLSNCNPISKEPTAINVTIPIVFLFIFANELSTENNKNNEDISISNV